VTRHGIRMSGMPAWEFRLSDQELWDVVAFMQRLPDLNAPQYAEWMAKAPVAPACGAEPAASAIASIPANPDRGRIALYQYACNACHMIPGVTGPDAHVGPSLQGIASRQLIAGTFANTPENLARWLRETQKVKPGTAMPQLGVVDQDARDIAAYLGTLR
jgi:cytochrome c1